MRRFTATTKSRILAVFGVGVLVTLISMYTTAGIFPATIPGRCAIETPTKSWSASGAEARAYISSADKQQRRLEKFSVNCAYLPEGGLPAEKLNSQGLTARAQRMFNAVRKEFGFVPYGGFAPGGVSTGHIPGSAHYQGRAVDFFFEPAGNADQNAAGWRLAMWAVVNAERLHVQTVIFDDMIWIRMGSWRGWKSYENPLGLTTPTARHLDHVHIDVT